MDVEYGSKPARTVYRLAIHLTLIVGAIIFSMPFVWMVSCSLKEDDEQMTGDLVWIPRLPQYQPASPFIDIREGTTLRKPQEVASGRWTRMEPAVRGVLADALKPFALDCGCTLPDDARGLLLAGLWRDLSGKVPSEKLKEEDALRDDIAQLFESSARDLISAESLKAPDTLRQDLGAAGKLASARIPADSLRDLASVKALLEKAWPEACLQIPQASFSSHEDLTARLRGVARDVSRRITSEHFKTEEERTRGICEWLKGAASEAQIRESHRRLYRGLALSDVTLRAEGQNDTRVLARGGTPDGELIWKTVERASLPAEVGPASVPAKGNAKVIPAGAEAGATSSLRQTIFDKKCDEELCYQFSRTGERATVQAVVPYENKEPPKSIAVGLKSDASWNRMWFAIEYNGKRYEATEPYCLGGMGKLYSEVYIQLPSPDDDDDMRIRHWQITKEVAPASVPAGIATYHNQPGTVKVEANVENTSAWTKTWDKATYNYKNSLRYIPFWRYFATSMFLVVINIVLAIFSSSLIAFAFARLKWPGREICWAILLATIMIPAQVTMIPNFLIMKWLGWYNTLRPMWIGSAFGSVFFIFMLRQFMKNIPKDLEDAAKIDGCTYWQIYWNVILPLVKPTLAAIGIFTFMNVWNDFMNPLMYLSDQKMYPLSLGLFAFQTIAGPSNQGMMMAASLMMTIPVIALFFVAQKQFIQGVTFTGIKG
ncbi:MAG TPA: ABC transporter permease subunit [Planctomycetota bacterium]|jgi:ABC-type glycerol-3-phosphate transport system permease component